MISVPEAGLLPSTPRPVWFMNGSMTSSGNPCGYVGKGVGVTTPASSQWPVVVSLPFERSSSRPATAGAPGWGGQPSSGITFPSPSASNAGRSRPPTARATLPSVFDPSSPNEAASGNSPAPTASSTITQARGTWLLYGAHGHCPRSYRPRLLHRLHRRARRRCDVGRRQAQPLEGAEAARGAAAEAGSRLDGRRREDFLERRVLEAVRLGDCFVGELP